MMNPLSYYDPNDPYPESDGRPMAENTEQYDWLVKIKENLEILFADREDVFIAGDLLWYPVSGSGDFRTGGPGRDGRVRKAQGAARRLSAVGRRRDRAAGGV
jgi:hypothetical protein